MNHNHERQQQIAITILSKEQNHEHEHDQRRNALVDTMPLQNVTESVVSNQDHVIEIVLRYKVSRIVELNNE